MKRPPTAWLRRLVTQRDWGLTPVAAMIGALAGVGAYGFEHLIEACEHLAFGWAAQEIGAPTWLLVLLAPALGGLVVGLLFVGFGKRGAGESVPNVIEALIRKEGKLSGRGAGYQAMASATTIGSGGSAGVEGPIVQIGSTLGSRVAALFHLDAKQTPALVGCGAAASIAAIFNAPIAGVLFVVEVVLRDYTLKTFVPIVVAAVFGTAVSQALAADSDPMFLVPRELHLYEFTVAELLPYAVLGLCCGLLAAGFVEVLQRGKRAAARTPFPRWARPAVGGLALGVIGCAWVLLGAPPAPGSGAPPFFGNGYPVIERLLDPAAYQAQGLEPAKIGALLLAAVLALKVLGTALTVVSGGGGGVIAPGLLLGAAMGGLFAIGLASAAPGLVASPAAYALAGMAGLIAALLHAPLAAFLLVFEVTQDYKVILPMMLVSIAATSTSRAIKRETLFEATLRQRGIGLGRVPDAVLLRRLTLRPEHLIDAAIVAPEDPAQRLLDLAETFAATDFAVADDQGVYRGMVIGNDVRTTLLQREAVPLLVVAELMRPEIPAVHVGESFEVILERFARHDVACLPVVDEDDEVEGLISRSRLLSTYHEELSTSD
ncbi:MAG: chloride channel protein [Planctomycetota bacterium]